MTKQLMFCLLQSLESLHTCASSGAVHWFLVLLSRVYLVSDAEVAGPVWAVLKKIIAELQVWAKKKKKKKSFILLFIRSSFAQRRKEPMQQLLQSRYGFYGRPFESEDCLFNLEQGNIIGASPGRAGWISNNSAKAGSSSIAASFAALHQLVRFFFPFFLFLFNNFNVPFSNFFQGERSVGDLVRTGAGRQRQDLRPPGSPGSQTFR